MKHFINHKLNYIVLPILQILVVTYGYSQFTQTIRGKVIDEASQSTLPGATVLLLNTDLIKSVITDKSGNFVITNAPVGRNRLKVSFLGYQPYENTSLMVTSGKEAVLTVELKESATNLKEVVVTSFNKEKAVNSMAMISVRSFSVEETRRYAGGMDDPGRLASVFAGVADGNIESNGIIVRGNAPAGVIYKVEGVEVDNPNHFAGEDFLGGGFVSILSNHVLSNSDFLTGAFPAEYGNALSAVFDMNLRTGNQDKREYAFQIGSLGLDFSSEGPFVKGEKSSYLFNYRYSTFGLVKAFLPKTEGIPVYQDLCFKLNFPHQKGALSIWGAGGTDSYTYGNLKNDSYAIGRTYVNDKSGTGFVGMKYKYFINQTTYSSITLLANASNKSNRLKEQYADREYYTSERIENLTGKYILSGFINKKFGASHTNRTGFNYSMLFYDMDNQVSKKIPLPPEEFINNNGSTGLLQAYSQSKVNLGDRLVMNVGIHYQYFHLNKKYSLEPRVGLNLLLNSKNTISIAYGKHSQIYPLGVYFIQRDNNGSVTYPNKNLDFTKSHHFILGYDRSFNEDLRLKVEVFYQNLDNVAVVPNSSLCIINLLDLNTYNEVLVSTGSARNIGIDFTLERFLKNGVYYQSAVSLFDSRYKGGDGKWRNTRYNKNFIANVVGGKEWNVGKQNFLGINGRVYLKNGDRTTPFDQEASALAGKVVYDETKAFEKQIPFTYRCDLSITYTVNRAKNSSKFALQLLNVLYSKVSFEDKFNQDTQKAESLEGRMLLPSVSWKIEF